MTNKQTDSVQSNMTLLDRSKSSPSYITRTVRI